jgi:hypothetical protein
MGGGGWSARCRMEEGKREREGPSEADGSAGRRMRPATTLGHQARAVALLHEQGRAARHGRRGATDMRGRMASRPGGSCRGTRERGERDNAVMGR